MQIKKSVLMFNLLKAKEVTELSLTVTIMTAILPPSFAYSQIRTASSVLSQNSL